MLEDADVEGFDHTGVRHSAETVAMMALAVRVARAAPAPPLRRALLGFTLMLAPPP